MLEWQTRKLLALEVAKIWQAELSRLSRAPDAPWLLAHRAGQDTRHPP